jgi:transposase-like protein
MSYGFLLDRCNKGCSIFSSQTHARTTAQLGLAKNAPDREIVKAACEHELIIVTANGGRAWSSEAVEEDTRMAKKGHSEEQILRALRQAESGARVADICREHGVSEATFYVWKKMYAGRSLNASRLSPQHVRGLLNHKLEDGLSAQTVRNIWTVPRRTLGEAVKFGLIIPETPARSWMALAFPIVSVVIAVAYLRRGYELARFCFRVIRADPDLDCAP